MKNYSVKNKTVLITLHIAAWIVFIILPQFVINNYWGDTNFVPWSFYINAAIYGLIFYINYIWLVPRFFLERKKVFYLTSALIVIIAVYFLNLYLDSLIRPEKFGKRVLENFEFGRKPPEQPFFERPFKKGPPIMQLKLYFFVLISFIVTGFSIGLKVIEQYGTRERRQRELEKEKLNSELAFLKNQVSPHFFFNTLNNIYSLIEINSGDAQSAVLKLSKLMRYLLYESESGMVNLDDEINFMNHYIDLMKLRLTKKVDIDLQLPEKKLKHKIPPLLFIPFVENAFKHGISYREKSFIKIQMTAEENKVFFICSNSIGKTKNEEIDKNHSGIGLKNVKKRLHLLFPEKHSLNFETTNQTYTVLLEIDLKQEI